MHLPDNLRNRLKKPLGILVKDSNVNKENILKHIPRGYFIIAVGDATTENLIKYGITPSLQIVDGVEKRIKRELPSGSVKTLLHCVNPPSEITNESLNAIKKAFQSPTPVRIDVDGEEDLLVLPTIAFSPKNSVVLYGQPNEGVVIVAITTETRKKVLEIMDSMD